MTETDYQILIHLNSIYIFARPYGHFFKKQTIDKSVHRYVYLILYPVNRFGRKMLTYAGMDWIKDEGNMSSLTRVEPYNASKQRRMYCSCNSWLLYINTNAYARDRQPNQRQDTNWESPPPKSKMDLRSDFSTTVLLVLLLLASVSANAKSKVRSIYFL